MSTVRSVDWVGVARSLHPLILEHADGAEEARSPSPAVVAAMADAGLFRLGTPAVYGGAQTDPLTIIAVLEAVAEADGATAWTLMVGLEAGLIIAAMEPSAASALTERHPGLVMCGSFAPAGRAMPGDGGLAVSGRWPYASGCTVADYFCGGCLVVDGDGRPVRAADDAPIVRQVIVPRADYVVDDTWHAAGLTATGSHDVTVSDAFVSNDHVIDIYGDGMLVDAPPYRLGLAIRLSLSKVGVATGIARHALTLFGTIAADKIPQGSRTSLRDSPGAQLALAEAEARLRSGRAFVIDIVGTIWDAILDDREITAHDRTLLRLACASCCRDAVTAVDLVAEQIGMAASTGPRAFTRAIRDVRVVPQHFWVAPSAIADAGRRLLGLEAPTPGF
jgi:alkylation response protein AidB-like acyl-CoA dehydrogenase